MEGPNCATVHMGRTEPDGFADLDEDAFAPSRGNWRLLARPFAAAAAYALLLGGVAYAYLLEGENTLVLAGREIILLDWVTLLSLSIVVIVSGPTIYGNPGSARSFVARFCRDRFAAACAAVLALLLAVAAFGSLLVPGPEVTPAAIYQPPYGVSVLERIPTSCVGTVADGECHGSLAHPLGTDNGGRDVLLTTVSGLRTSLQVGLSAAVIAGGIGTSVGVVAGTVGGRVDDILMRYVDVQSAVPAFFAYVLIVAILSADLVLMVVVFGLLSWGGLARLVRSEVRRIREELYVRAATASGAGSLHNIRYHVLPNAASAVLVPLSTLVPTYILYEAALSFLGFGESDPRIISLGSEIDRGMVHRFSAWWDVWWHPAVPAVALTLLVLVTLVVGDRTADLADPRER